MSDELPENVVDWLQSLAQKHDKDYAELENLYYREMDYYNQLLEEQGGKEAIGEDMFHHFVKSSVLGEIQKDISIPKKEMEFFFIGSYPPKVRNGNSIVDVVGWGLDPNDVDSEPKKMNVTIWNDLVPKRLEFSTFGTYRTFFAEKNTKQEYKDSNVYDVTLTSLSSLDEQELDWANGSFDDKKAVIEQRYPVVPLGEAHKNMTKLQKIDNKTSIPKVTDVKRIRVMIVNHGEGVTNDGRAWFRYDVTDDTFQPSEKQPYFTVWVDPEVARSVNCGNKSFVDIYGMIKRNLNKNTIEMTACNIVPVLKVPLDSVDNKVDSQNKDDNESKGFPNMSNISKNDNSTETSDDSDEVDEVSMVGLT